MTQTSLIGITRENLGNVTNVDSPTLAGRFSRDIHQTAEVSSCEDIGLGFKDPVQFLGYHRIGYLRVFDREGSTEAAADIAIRHFDELNSIHAFQKLPRLGGHAYFSD